MSNWTHQSSNFLYLQTIGFMMEICCYTSLIYVDYCYFFSSRNIEPFRTYKNFSSLEDEHADSPPFMDKVLSEEIVKKDNKMGGNIPGGNFLGGNFPEGIFPGGIFLELYQSCYILSLAWYMRVSFWNFCICIVKIYMDLFRITSFKQHKNRAIE